MLVGERGAAGGDRGHHARLVEPDGIEVSLDEQRHRLAPDGFTGPVQGEERETLLVERRIGGVEVLRFALPLEKAPAEADDAAALSDRNHQTATKPVVQALALLARNPEAGLLGQARIDALQGVGLDQRIPEIGGVSEPPRPGRVLGDAPLAQVLARDLALGMLPEHALVERARLLVHLGQRRAAGRPAGFLRIRRSEVHAGLVGELLDRLAEAAAFHLHDELDRVAGDPAAEAMEHLLVRDDVEAGCLLAVDRAEPLPVVPALLQRHAPLHHRDQVHPVAQLLQLLVGDARQTVRPAYD